MKKRAFGQIVLIVAILMLVLSGASIWFNWFDRSISTALFVISLILIGSGTYLSKKSK